MEKENAKKLQEYEARIAQLEEQVGELTAVLGSLTKELTEAQVALAEQNKSEEPVELLEGELSLEAILDEFGPKRVKPRLVRKPRNEDAG